MLFLFSRTSAYGLRALLLSTIFLLNACVGLTFNSQKQAEALRVQMQMAEKSINSSVDRPRIIYAGFAMHSESMGFLKDIRAGEKFAKLIDSDAVVYLLNNPTLFQSSDLPLANRANIEQVIKHIGRIARPQDKIIMLFSTHGAPDNLAIYMGQYYPSIRSADLQQWLQPLRSKPVTLLLSACFSGSFVEPLKSPNRMIFTAAAKDRSSFGCSFFSSGTFFVDGLFNQDVHNMSLIQMALLAREKIAQREFAMKLSPPSEPQANIGDAMVDLANEPVMQLRKFRFIPKN